MITLGIIGIVAALTMPALVANYRKHQTVTRLKKAYSALENAYKLSEAENGERINWEGKNQPLLEQYVFPYLKTIKTCPQYTAKDCGFSSAQWLNGSVFDFNGGYTAVILADGTSVAFRNEDQQRMSVYIDINGEKSPNTVGKDIFRLGLGYGVDAPKGYTGHTPREELLNGTTLSPTYGCNNTGGNGMFCLFLIQHDGWEIAPDYPW